MIPNIREQTNDKRIGHSSKVGNTLMKSI